MADSPVIATVVKSAAARGQGHVFDADVNGVKTGIWAGPKMDIGEFMKITEGALVELTPGKVEGKYFFKRMLQAGTPQQQAPPPQQQAPPPQHNFPPADGTHVEKQEQPSKSEQLKSDIKAHSILLKHIWREVDATFNSADESGLPVSDDVIQKFTGSIYISLCQKHRL